MAKLPCCAVCRTGILAGQNALFRADGRTQHLVCPEVRCSVCGGTILPSDPIRRDGDALTHGNCWAKRHARCAGSAELLGSEALTVAIRIKLKAGMLPVVEPRKVWAGLGKELACNGCSRVIASTDVEYDVDRPGGGALRFHRNCLDVWQREVGKRAREIGGGSAALPWTLFFDLHIARRAAHDRAAHDECRTATAEVVRWTVELGARSQRIRAARPRFSAPA